MPWLWKSWEEYVECVNPALIDGSGMYRSSVLCSSFDTSSDLFDAYNELMGASRKLSELGFTGNPNDHPPARGMEISEEIERVVHDLVFHGEELLLYHKRLAQSDWADGFLYQHEIVKDEHWERYKSNGRLAREIRKLAEETNTLLSGYLTIQREDEDFIIKGLELPKDLEADFRTARNLFSLGFDDVGLLIAGRGLEGVLRKIAKSRKIKIEIKGKQENAWDIDFRDLVEVMYRLRWKSNDSRLISASTKSLLDFLRTIRNQNAHPIFEESASEDNRATATLIVRTANRLWQRISENKKTFQSNVIQKNW